MIEGFKKPLDIFQIYTLPSCPIRAAKVSVLCSDRVTCLQMCLTYMTYVSPNQMSHVSAVKYIGNQGNIKIN